MFSRNSRQLEAKSSSSSKRPSNINTSRPTRPSSPKRVPEGARTTWRDSGDLLNEATGVNLEIPNIPELPTTSSNRPTFRRGLSDQRELTRAKEHHQGRQPASGLQALLNSLQTRQGQEDRIRLLIDTVGGAFDTERGSWSDTRSVHSDPGRRESSIESEWSASCFPLPPGQRTFSVAHVADEADAVQSRDFATVYPYPDASTDQVHRTAQSRRNVSSIRTRSSASTQRRNSFPRSAHEEFTLQDCPGVELAMPLRSSEKSPTGGRQITPSRAIYNDFRTAHSSITTGNSPTASSRATSPTGVGLPFSLPGPSFQTDPDVYIQAGSPVRSWKLRTSSFAGILGQGMTKDQEEGLRSPSIKSPNRHALSPSTWSGKFTGPFSPRQRGTGFNFDSSPTVDEGEGFETEAYQGLQDPATATDDPSVGEASPSRKMSRFYTESSIFSLPEEESVNEKKGPVVDVSPLVDSQHRKQPSGSTNDDLISFLEDDEDSKSATHSFLDDSRDDSVVKHPQSFESDRESAWETESEKASTFRTQSSGLGKFEFSFQNLKDTSRHPPSLATTDTRSKQSDSQIAEASYGLPSPPPQTKLPPIPPAGQKPLQKRPLRYDTTDSFTPSTSYGDTRNLSQLSPNPQATDTTEPTSPLAESDSPVVPGLVQSNANTADSFRLPAASATSRNGSRSRPQTSGGKTEASWETDPDSKNSRSLSISQQDALYEDIRRQVRRTSAYSGGSKTSGSVVVANENGVRKIRHFSHPESEAEDRFGVQSTSSEGAANEFCRSSPVDSAHDADEQGPAEGNASRDLSSRQRSDVDTFGERPATSSGKSYATGDDVNDADWETIGDGRELSRYNTGNSIDQGRTGSSLADFTTFSSLESQGYQAVPGQGSVPSLPSIHQGDPRYEFTYQFQQMNPDQPPILFPTYRYPHGHDFPYRNAMTPPNHSQAYKQHLGKQRLRPSVDEPGPSKAALPAIEPKSLSDKGHAREIEHQTPLRTLQPEGSWPEGLDRSSNAGSLTSSAWMSVYGGMARDISETGMLPGANGSFAKPSNLGPRANVTGTSQGTGMREFGSSPADASSVMSGVGPSPGQMRSSPCNHMETLVEQRSPISSPSPAYLRGHSHMHTPQSSQSVEIDGQIQAHRELLRKEGLLPHNPGPQQQVHLRHSPSDGRWLSLDFDQPTTAAAERAGSRTTFRDGEQRSESRTGLRRDSFWPQRRIRESPLLRSPELERTIGMDYRLYEAPRENSSIATDSREQKREVSRIVLVLCFLFPPLLLLYGYGILDTMMIEMTHGRIRRFGAREKKFAKWAGWSIAGVAVVGIIIALIVVAVG